MPVTYGFFNSVEGDRRYDADQMSNYFKGLISNGVYEGVGSALQVLAGTGMSVNVQTGRAIIDCKWINLDAVETLEITAASPILPRWTAIVVRLDIPNRLMELDTVDGTAAADPEQPDITNTDTVKELCLAMVYVPAGSTSISQVNITDMRGSEYCLWVTGLIDQLDTSTLWLQWETGFNEWFDALTGRLNVNTYIQAYKKTVTLDGTVTSAVLDMTGYTYDAADIIDVYINGLYATEGTDYSISVSGSTATVTGLPAVSGTVVNLKAVKSKIGFTILAVNGSEALGTDNDEAILTS